MQMIAAAGAAAAAAWVKLWLGWSPNLHLITYNQAPAHSLWLSLLPLQDGPTYLIVQLLDAPGVNLFFLRGSSDSRITITAGAGWFLLGMSSPPLKPACFNCSSHICAGSTESFQTLVEELDWRLFSPWISAPSAAWHPANIADVPHEYCICCPHMKNYGCTECNNPCHEQLFPESLGNVSWTGFSGFRMHFTSA